MGKLDGAEMDYRAVLKLEPNNKAAKKQLAALKERLHQNVKFTFDRPENCSKSKLTHVPIREINNKHIKSVSGLKLDSWIAHGLKFHFHLG